MTVELLSAAFLLLTALMAVAVIGLFSRFLEGRARSGAIAALLLWLLYAGAMGYSGVVASMRPPGPVFLLVPFMVFLVAFLTRHPGAAAFARRVPLTTLIALQVFRVGVELVLDGLYRQHLVPRLMTFEGGDWDILVGVTAPLIAWLYGSGKITAAAVRAWSVVGIVLLANIVVRALLTFPGASPFFHTGDVPNRAIGIFPFTFLPGFLAPLALCLHVLVLSSLPQEAGVRRIAGEKA